MKTAHAIALLVPVALALKPARADERILNFHSDITVHADNALTVRETIEVRSEQKEIRHGIYRDFPTNYQWAGTKYVVGFDVEQILRDGQPDDYHFENRANGRRVYIGRNEVMPSPGKHIYTLVYRTTRQIGFFADHDELYFNVTGNGWIFPIDQTSASVTLPDGVPFKDVKLEAYTGPQGSQAHDYTAARGADNHLVFRATRPLTAHEGLTIVVSFPKGFVHQPTVAETFAYTMRDNRVLLMGIAGLLIVLAYYMIVWILVGRDPPHGTIIPRFAPPKGFSPAGARYLSRMGYDQKCFTAAVLNMAVNKCLTIKESGGIYTLSKVGADDPPLAAEECLVAESLFRESPHIALVNTNHAKISTSIQKLKKELSFEFEKRFFYTNGKFLIPGVLLSLIVVLTAGFLGEIKNVYSFLFMCVWLTVWSLGVGALLFKVCGLWKTALTGNDRITGSGGALFLTLFSIPFVAGEVFGCYMFSTIASVWIVPLLVALAALSAAFHQLLKAPTRNGRALMDELDGFKMYLGTAEKDRLNSLNPPDRTPELFETFLPYALALDVENQWAEQFSDVLSAAGSDAGGHGSYSPAWYSGPSWRSAGASGFASSVGSALTSAISSASTAPGSSSGGGGGGSSGGGGGGGGGGGW